MLKGDVKSYKGAALSATKIEDTMTETVNTERMKADGVYETYKMLVPKNGYVRITYKKEKDNG